MSGFIVIYNKNKVPVNSQLLHTLTNTLKMRGPDKQRTHIQGHLGMGHALFKTTYEAEYENQPATLDGHIWIVGSMRIDDREHLVSKLGLKNKLNLNTTPDSELILHAYRKWKDDCLKHLLGDFAFVIWDSRIEKLFLGTDIFAREQLYYAETQHSFIVSNNIYTLLKHPEISKNVNDKAMAYFLMFGRHQWADKSITAFKDIQALPPASSLVLKNKHLYTIQKYWTPSLGRPILRYKNDEEYIEHFLDIFRSAISDRVRTDSIVVPMSGGMDSTSIMAILMEMKNNSNINTSLQAITALTKVATFECKEEPYAQSVANYLNVPIEFETNTEGLLQSNILTTSPVPAFTPNFIFSTIQKRYANYARVSLQGNGSDELFLSTSIINSFNNENPMAIIKNIFSLKNTYGTFPPFGLRSFIKVHLDIKRSSTYPLHFKWLNPTLRNEIQSDMLEEYVFTPLKLHKEQRHKPTVSALLKASWNYEDYQLDPSFTKVESREPFLDKRMIEFILSLPEQPWTHKKHLLRSAMKGKLPEKVLQRPKEVLQGWTNTLFSAKESQWIHTWSPSNSLEQYINFKEVKNSKELFLEEKATFSNIRMIILAKWLDQVYNLKV